MRLILQKFGLAVGILWAVIVGICWLITIGFLLVVSEPSFDGVARFAAVGMATGMAVVALLIGGLIVALWVWIFEP